MEYTPSKGFVTLTSTLDGFASGVKTINVIPPSWGDQFDTKIKIGRTMLTDNLGKAKWLIIGTNPYFSQLDIQLLDGFPNCETLPTGTRLFILQPLEANSPPCGTLPF